MRTARPQLSIPGMPAPLLCSPPITSTDRDLPSPGPITSYPHQLSWRTQGAYFQGRVLPSTTHGYAAADSPQEELPYQPEITVSTSDSFISQGATLVLGENGPDVGAPILQENVPVQYPPRIQTYIQCPSCPLVSELDAGVITTPNFN